MWSSTVDPYDLYENNIVEPVKTMMLDIARMRRADLSERITVETLAELLKILDNLLKYVSDLVKRALQVKKLGSAATGNESLASQAERLLHVNRPLVTCSPFLISLVFRGFLLYLKVNFFNNKIHFTSSFMRTTI